MTDALIAPRLRSGAIVGVVSPASPPRDESAVMQGISALLEQGHYPRLGRSVGAKLGYLAGPDEVRARDLMDMFADERIGAIFCTRGGYGSARILDHLDYSFIRAHPKILIGFSDVTALSLALFSKTRLVTFAGPMVAAEFASGIHPTAAVALWDMIKVKKTSRRLPFCEETIPLRDGIVQGTLLGGNLAVFCSLIGTPWMPDPRGAILFLEDVGESVYRIDRLLLQLRHSGVLGQVGGVLLGSFTAVPEESPNRDLMDVLKEYLLPLEVPVLANFPFGHIPDKITLPIGSRVRLDSSRRSVTIMHPVVS